MKSKSKLEYIRTTGRQIKNCTANKAISTTDAVRRIDRRTKTDKKTDNQTDGMTTRNQTDRQTNRQRTKRTERQTPTNKRTTNIFFTTHFVLTSLPYYRYGIVGKDRHTFLSDWLQSVHMSERAECMFYTDTYHRCPPPSCSAHSDPRPWQFELLWMHNVTFMSYRLTLFTFWLKV